MPDGSLRDVGDHGGKVVGHEIVATHIIKIDRLIVAHPCLTAPERIGGGGSVGCAFSAELNDHRHVVAQQGAVGLEIIVGIEHDGVGGELHATVGGVKIENLIHNLVGNISARLGAVGLRNDKRLATQLRIEAALALLHPHIAHGVVAIGHDGIGEEVEDVVASVTTVGVAHHNLRKTAVVGNDGIAKLLPL